MSGQSVLSAGAPAFAAKAGLWREACLIDGCWRQAESGARDAIYSPYDHARLGAVPRMGALETGLAIEGAARAGAAWADLPAQRRAGVLHAWSHALEEHAVALARIVTSEQGKPLAEALEEVRHAAAYLQWFAEQCRRIDGEILQSPHSRRRMMVLRQPVGVCAAITPWNFPVSMVARKAGPALAAGCTMVLKPAAQTPFSALAMAALACEAGVPAGVLQVVTGDPAEIGATLCDSPIVRKLSFTGSTGVGSLLMARCAPTIKRLSLELGGHAPFIVFEDADLDAAARGLMLAKFRNAGQTCVAANRIYVQEAVYQAFAARVSELTCELVLGDGLAPDTTMGPLIGPEALAKVNAHVQDAVARGARVLCGGSPGGPGVNFYPPTVLAEVDDAMRCTREETFGPVAPLLRFADEAQVLARANASPYGLAGYVYTRDAARARRMSERLECGMVAINTGRMSSEAAPFGGIKQSGLGREGSRHGLDEYLEFKYVCVDDD